MTDNVKPPRAKRDSLFLGATLDVGDGVSHDVRVRNLSATGMMVDGDANLQDGAQLTATIRGIGDIRGRVAWVVERRAGIAFDVAIDPTQARKSVSAAVKPPLPLESVPSIKRPGLRTR